ncbi:hypothetical protein LNKW23_32820 [Paralimibaculum aggregatum]|uniref:Uncharacterized protein n=1 Tax=Paralimibaculum aggregatum TaxID=3036245 RepID=A0ABQ6LRD2_9RHOB|nr:hypothetical protein [Limibaculum sp. NKW23]GMG84068.1 hypothetical protein LNKW23_32820 [Limibaculum sp. NKW23]
MGPYYDTAHRIAERLGDRRPERLHPGLFGDTGSRHTMPDLWTGLTALSVLLLAGAVL